MQGIVGLLMSPLSRKWMVSQALFREFGGRIILQQAGREPIDAYRRLLGQAEAQKVCII